MFEIKLIHWIANRCSVRNFQMVGVLCLENYGRFQYMAKTTHVSVILYENNLYTETTTGFTY